MQEERVELDIEKMSLQPMKSQTFTVNINTTFFDCARCCGAQIIGCYSPVAGEHCERPLEIGKLLCIYYDSLKAHNHIFLPIFIYYNFHPL